MYKYKKIDGKKIKYFAKNNNSKWTVLFIHGFNSNAMFAKNLFTMKNDYNIIALDLVQEGTKENVEYDQVIKIVNKFIKKIRTTKLIVLGHSLAGGIIAKVGSNPKVRKLVYMSTITPDMINTAGYKFLKNHHQPKNKLALMLSNKIEKKAREKYEWVHAFLDRDSIWAGILNETALNEKFMNKLDKRYRLTKYKSYYVVGKEDKIINTKAFIEYVTSLRKEVQIIGIRHNPIKTAPAKMNEFLNKLAKGSKRRIKKGLIW